MPVAAFDGGFATDGPRAADGREVHAGATLCLQLFLGAWPGRQRGGRPRVTGWLAGWLVGSACAPACGHLGQLTDCPAAWLSVRGHSHARRLQRSQGSRAPGLQGSRAPGLQGSGAVQAGGEASGASKVAES
ncbi:hypothetical protein BS50DRAFT_220209 [Corynespora cassiicola Philippines]|uniref:Uncharacterized protein n=1 Tax=Corynespora cassiicola Philippines TaxID=1448308 RepID=A0A2T2N323_CORCC|nr:hypothetical protein BS50DRAFT_220209 [Corynespora cassiicola Philippines]